MKNKSIIALLGITILFVGLMIGIYIGTSSSRNYITLDYDPNIYANSPTAQLPAMVKMDLNLATTEELTIIPGIGESTAKNIIEYRNKIGRFYKIEDLLNVKGIGKKQLEEISKYATVAN